MNYPDIFITAGLGNIFERLGIDGKTFLLRGFAAVNISIGGGIDDNLWFCLFNGFDAISG